MARSARQLKILELINKKDIETQDDLAAELMMAHFSVTQATISRDIKELGLFKISASDGKQKYSKETTNYNVSNKIISMFKNAVISIDYALNIVVIKTLSGSANAAGLMVDKLNNSEILGCVAGDDTIMIVTKNEDVAISVVNALSEILNR